MSREIATGTPDLDMSGGVPDARTLAIAFARRGDPPGVNGSESEHRYASVDIRILGGMAGMSRSALDTISPLTALDALPIRLEETVTRGAAATRLLLLVPCTLAIAIPVAAVAFAASSAPETLTMLAERPIAAAQIAAGLAMWLALFALPASRTIGRLWSRREVRIADGMAEIVDRSPVGTRTRVTPIHDYRGIAHHIRASLSGLTHEIVLVHADPALTVTLVASDRVTQTMIDKATALLALPEIPARSLYERKPRQQVLGNETSGLATAPA
jgi:hypothetical protein